MISNIEEIEMNNAILKAVSVLAFTATLAGAAYAADGQENRARATLVIHSDQGVPPSISDRNEPVARATAVLPPGNVYQSANANEGPVEGD
jgi:hypothetical protein